MLPPRRKQFSCEYNARPHPDIFNNCMRSWFFRDTGAAKNRNEDID